MLANSDLHTWINLCGCAVSKEEVQMSSSFTPLLKFFMGPFQFYTFSFFSKSWFPSPSSRFSSSSFLARRSLISLWNVPRSGPIHLCFFFFFFFTSLSIPPSPTLQLFSTLCRLGFRQAGSYQATGYMLIGSVSTSVFLPGSCMGLTAVMFCRLLIPWSQGGGLAAELGFRHQAIILFSGWTFASLDEVTHGITMLP